MDADMTCMATFVPSGAVILTVTVRGSASGTVSVSVNGTVTLTCSIASICIASFTPGTSVTLTQASGSGASFKSWGGACTGACTVTMNTNQSVTATFQKVFTDDPLGAGNVIKAVHITELRDAINTLRAVNSQGSYPWTETLTQRSTVVKKDHLAQVWTALGQAAPDLPRSETAD